MFKNDYFGLNIFWNSHVQPYLIFYWLIEEEIELLKIGFNIDLEPPSE